MRIGVSGALLGACLLVIPPAAEPNVEHRAAAHPVVALAAVVDGIDGGPLSVSVTDASTSGGTAGLNLGDLSAVSGGEPPDLGGLLSVTAGMASADPLGDFLTTIFYGGLFLFSGILGSVGQLFQSAWDWIAGVFGLAPYPAAAEALGTAVTDAAGAFDPSASTELVAALGDITALDSSVITDPGTAVDGMGDGVGVDAGIADLGLWMSSLIP